MSNRKYTQHAIADSDPHTLYVCLLSNGMVKLGRSKNAALRIRGISSLAFNRYGATVDEVICFPGYAIGQNESIFLEAVREKAENVKGTKEYFAGISFAAVQKIVEETYARICAKPAPALSARVQPMVVPRSLDPIVRWLNKQKPGELIAAAVACDCSTQTLRNIRDGKVGKFGPAYFLVANIWQYIEQHPPANER